MIESGEFIRVGFTMMRDPKTGGLADSVPLYIKADDRARANAEKLMRDMAATLARLYSRQTEEVGE